MRVLLDEHLPVDLAPALHGQPLPGLTGDALDALRANLWPGNVRELRNALKRAAVLADGPITLRDLPGEFRGARPVPAAAPGTTGAGGAGGVGATLKDVVRHVVETAERDLIVRALERTRENAHAVL